MQSEYVSAAARPEWSSPTARADEAPAWYCARTKPKNEHIAAANVRVNLGLEVFHPRLRSKQRTYRGVIRLVTEPLFPGYIFVRCVLEQSIDQLRHTSGISSIVNFGKRIPAVPEAAMAELQECFGTEEMLDYDKHPAVGDGVRIYAGAFFGMQAVVLRSWPAKRRVQILLDILGRPTPLEMDSSLVQLENKPMAELLPVLAAPGAAVAAAW
jgi:transcriptional antiterminator RfaH